MINAITGRPGGGKSYEAVAFHIIPALEKERKIVTNLPLQLDYFSKVFGDEILDLIKVIDGKLTDFGSMYRPFSSHEDYFDDWRNKDGQAPLYIIDEAHMVLPNKSLDSKILEFYSMHRHYGIDIILITQNVRKINKDIRDMIEIQYICQKNTALGSTNTYTQKVKNGAVSGEVVNTRQRSYKSEYFKYYKSHSESNKEVNESLTQDITPIWKRWPFIGSLICFIAFFPLVSVVFSDSDKPIIEQSIEKDISSDKLNDVNDSVIENKQVDYNVDHPLSMFKMFVTGYASQFVVDTESGNLEYDEGLNFHRVYIDVYENKKKLFSIDDRELLDLGYEIQMISDCFYKIKYNSYSALITCGQEALPKSTVEAMGDNLF